MVVPLPVAAARRTARPRWSWLAAAAAVVMLAAGLGYVGGGASIGGAIADRDSAIEILRQATATTLRVQRQPDARLVALSATTQGVGATGSLLFSATDGELVAMAADLPPLAAGQEYGCWVDAGGSRVRLGRMYWAGGLWTWAGPVDGLAGLPPDAVFGVSAGAPGGGSDATPMLTGGL